MGTEQASIPSYLRDLKWIAFICGCGHSGTTLVATILSRHPEIHVPLCESEAFLETEEIAAAQLGRLRDDTIAAGKRILIEKTPRHVRKIGLMRRMVPGARFILMVRDGRDVTASIANRFAGDFRGGVVRWMKDNTFVLRERNKPDAFILRYEDVVSNPRRQIRGLCSFLGVTYSDELLKPDAEPRLWYGRTEVRRTSGFGPMHEDLRNWQVNQPIFDGRGRWKQQLPPRFAEEFEDGRPRDLMLAFGYGKRRWWQSWRKSAWRWLTNQRRQK